MPRPALEETRRRHRGRAARRPRQLHLPARRRDRGRRRRGGDLVRDRGRAFREQGAAGDRRRDRADGAVEHALTAVTTSEALPQAREAVRALQRAFGHSRYLAARAAGPRPDRSGAAAVGRSRAAADWNRALAPPAADPQTDAARAALMDSSRRPVVDDSTRPPIDQARLTRLAERTARARAGGAPTSSVRRAHLLDAVTRWRRGDRVRARGAAARGGAVCAARARSADGSTAPRRPATPRGSPDRRRRRTDGRAGDGRAGRRSPSRWRSRDPPIPRPTAAARAPGRPASPRAHGPGRVSADALCKEAGFAVDEPTGEATAIVDDRVPRMQRLGPRQPSTEHRCGRSTRHRERANVSHRQRHRSRDARRRAGCRRCASRSRRAASPDRRRRSSLEDAGIAVASARTRGRGRRGPVAGVVAVPAAGRRRRPAARQGSASTSVERSDDGDDVDVLAPPMRGPIRTLVVDPGVTWPAMFVRRAIEGEPAFAVAAVQRAATRIATRAGAPPAALTRASTRAVRGARCRRARPPGSAATSTRSGGSSRSAAGSVVFRRIAPPSGRDGHCCRSVRARRRRC